MKHAFFLHTIISILLISLAFSCTDSSTDSNDLGDSDSDTSENEDGDLDNSPVLIDPSVQVEDLILEPETPFSPELPEGIRLRVASYNIYGGNFADAEAIGNMLKTLNLDMVGLQECPESFVAPIAQAGGFPYSYGSGIALLSKTELNDTELVPLSVGRSFLHAHSEVSGVMFSFYVAHLGWNAEGDLQFREFVDEHLKQDTTKHMVLVGDFNDEHYSSQVEIMEEVATDAFTKIGWYPGERISWPSTGFDDTEGSQLIDLIWFRKELPALVLDADVVNLSPVLSDHKPVWAELLYPSDPDSPFSSDPFEAQRDLFADFPTVDNRPANLLINPGAEDGTTGWTLSGEAVSVAERENQTPYKGSAFFTGFSTAPDDETRFSTGEQIVDLSEWAADIDAMKARLLVSGYMRTGFTIDEEGDIRSNIPKPNDEAEIVTEALDENGQVLLQLHSKRRDTLNWHPYADFLELPPNTRKARLSWIAHHKAYNGAGNDAAFDELYLGIDLLETSHQRLGGNLLENPGAEDIESTHWETTGWQSLPSMVPYGFIFFPPCSFSGERFFYGGGAFGVEAGEAGTSLLAQVVDLSSYSDELASDQMALHWGGWFRTVDAANTLSLALEIYDGDGSLWGTIPGGELFDAEWRPLQNRTRIPAGAASVRLIVSSELSEVGTSAMADALYVIPERIE